ncbi:MAG: DUF4350 domain-containing protein [Acidimicrobiales bacterium]|nr:DUF4350 domain-containing protein [Acidimicrobiales bacterium]
MRARSSLQILGAIALLLAVAVLIGRPGNDGPPLDPNSVGELGTMGLVEFMETSGVSVTRGIPAPDTDVVLVLRDQLDGSGREELLDWIRAGGEAVITDQTSPLVDTGLRDLVAGEDLAKGMCDIDGLDDVSELVGGSLALLEPVPRSQICFGDFGGAYIVRFPEGDGFVTALGGAIPFINRNLDEGDNAVLAGRLLLGETINGSERQSASVIYIPFGVGNGQRSATDLIGSNVRWFGVQLLVVAFVGLLWAIRRFGPIVHEPPVVELPGSLAVRATAELHRRSKTGPASAAVIQASLAARVRNQFRVSRDGDVEFGANQVASRSGIPADDVLQVLVASPPAPDTPTALKQSQQLDKIGQQLLHPAALHGAPDPSPSSSIREEQHV